MSFKVESDPLEIAMTRLGFESHKSWPVARTVATRQEEGGEGNYQIENLNSLYLKLY